MDISNVEGNPDLTWPTMEELTNGFIDDDFINANNLNNSSITANRSYQKPIRAFIPISTLLNFPEPPDSDDPGPGDVFEPPFDGVVPLPGDLVPEGTIVPTAPDGPLGPGGFNTPRVNVETGNILGTSIEGNFLKNNETPLEDAKPKRIRKPLVPKNILKDLKKK